MPIEFRCDQCDHLLRTPDEAAGKKARCPACKHIQDVPDSPLTPTTDAAETEPSEPAPTPDSPRPAANPFSAEGEPLPVAENTSNPYATPVSDSASSRDLARARVRLPALILLVLTVLSVLFFSLGFVGTLVQGNREGWSDDSTGGLVVCAASVFFGMFVLAGTVQMLRLKSYTLAVAAMVIAIVPVTCQFCVTIPFGIWGLIVVLDSNVKSEFG